VVSYTHEGFCKHYTEDRGFGFFAITSHPGERDCFFHVSDLERSGIKQIKVGDKVTFNVVADEKSRRNKATDIRMVI
jgi:CspA family cold shock protein